MNLLRVMIVVMVVCCCCVEGLKKKNIYASVTEQFEVLMNYKGQPKYLPQVKSFYQYGKHIFDDELDDDVRFDEFYHWDLRSSSKDFRCLIPYTAANDVPVMPTEEELNQSVLPFLEEMKDIDCFYLNTGWWTYEFCYKKYIRQFHQNENGVVEVLYVLGEYKSANIPYSHMHDDYFSEKYTMGTVCDLTQKQRTTEIRYVCSLTNSKILHIQEPSSCNYIITIETPVLCDHPRYRIPPQKLEHIVCFEKPIPSLKDLDNIPLSVTSTRKPAKGISDLISTINLDELTDSVVSTFTKGNTEVKVLQSNEDVDEILASLNVDLTSEKSIISLLEEILGADLEIIEVEEIEEESINSETTNTLPSTTEISAELEKIENQNEIEQTNNDENEKNTKDQ